MCQPGGFVNSFLCPNGTVFNQKVFVCDWWFNVDCVNSHTFYDLNSNIYATPVHEVDNDLDAERRSLEERNEPNEQTIPFSREPVSRRPVSRRPILQEPEITREVTRTPVTRREYTRQPATRAPYTRQPATRAPFTRQTATRTPFTRQPTRTPYTRQPTARNMPETRNPVTITRNPITRNPFIVDPDVRRPIVIDEPRIITRPTTRPITVGRAITVTEHKGRLRPDPLPIIIPRQKIQIFPVGFGQRINRKVEAPPKDSFEDILNFGPVDNDFTARSGRSSESIGRDIEDILSAFPGPRRLR